ncbi:polycystin family receptor for egg jelly-like [Branchiostoma floridae x Branchiostoma belcheri]
MTVTVCRLACGRGGYVMSLLTNGSSCSCTSDAMLNLTSKECSLPCSGDSSKICGGKGAYSVFRSSGLIIPEPSDPEPISEIVFEVEGSQPYVLVSDLVRFNFSVRSGSDVMFYIRFGDDTPEEESSNGVVHHVFKEAKTFVVNITAMNDIGSVWRTFYVTVELLETPIRHVEVVAIPTEPGRPPEIQPFLVGGQDATCWLSYGDGFIVEFVSKQISNFTNTHIFPKAGDYLVELNCSNHLGSMTAQTNALLQDRVEFQLMTEMLDVEYGDSFNVSCLILNGTNSTFWLAIGNDSSVAYREFNPALGNLTFQLGPDHYDCPGTYAIAVSAFNLVTPVLRQIGIVNVLEQITNLTISGEITYATPGQNVALQAKASSGTDVHLVWDIQGSPMGVYAAEDDGSSTSLGYVSFSLPRIGEYEVYLAAFNNLGQQETASHVLVDNVVQGLSLRSSTPVSNPPGEVVYEIMLPSDNSIPGAATAVCQISFGDGTVSDAEPVNFTATSFYELAHVFNRSVFGLLVARANCSNALSFQVFETDVYVYEPISITNLLASYWVVDGEFEKPGYGPERRLLPVEEPVIFTVQLDTDDGDVTTQWSFGDGQDNATASLKTSHQFDHVGTYHVIANVSNPISGDMVATSVELQRSIKFRSFTAVGERSTGIVLNFTLDVEEFGQEHCILWDFGDGSSRYLYGVTACKEKEKYNETNVIFMESQNYTINMSHSYDTEAGYVVTAEGVNKVSRVVAEIKLYITTRPLTCSFPHVQMKFGRYPTSPVVRMRSSTLKAAADVVVRCEVTRLANFTWTVNRVVNVADAKTGLIEPQLEFVSTSESPTPQRLFPARTFPYGLYRITLTVAMRGVPGMVGQDSMFAEIEKSPLVVAIRGGTSRAVGFNKTLELDGVKETYDPDVGNMEDKSGLQYVWFCRRGHEKFPMTGDELDTTVRTTPSEDELQLIFEDRTLDNGGCYGTGPGRLNVSAGVTTLNTFWFFANMTYVFRIRVTKGDRVGWFEQAVYISPGDPPELIISCDINCMSKMNPSRDFQLTVTCLTCVQGLTTYYSWQIFHLQKDVDVVTEIPNLNEMTYKGTTSPSLVLKGGSLVGGRWYRFRLTGKQRGYEAGFTEYEFSANLPPYGGSCDVTPKTGYALATPFQIKCKNWRDESDRLSRDPAKDHGKGLFYEFKSRHFGAREFALIYYGLQSFIPPTPFELGPKSDNYTYNVVVTITDATGESTDVMIPVKVYPEPIVNLTSTLEEVVGGAELESMLQSRNIQAATQLIVSVASLLNNRGDDAIVIEKAEKEIGQLEEEEDIEEVDVEESAAPTEIVTTENATTLNMTTLAPTDVTETSTAMLTTSTVRVVTEVKTEVDLARERQLEEEQTRRQEEEEAQLKTKRVEMRSSLVQKLSDSSKSMGGVQDLGAVQQYATAMKAVTQRTDEVNEGSQLTVVDVLKDMVSALSTFAIEDETDTDDVRNAANDLIGGLGNVLQASVLPVEGIVLEPQELGVEEDTGETDTPPESKPKEETAETNEGDLQDDQEPLEEQNVEEVIRKRHTAKKVAEQALQAVEDVASTLFKRVLPGAPPVQLMSPTLEMQLQRDEPYAVTNRSMRTISGNFLLPEQDVMFADMNTTGVLVDCKVLAMPKNPFSYVDSAALVKSPVLSLEFRTQDGTELEMRGLRDEVAIELSNPADHPPQFTELTFPRLKIYSVTFRVPTDNSSVHVLVYPEDPAVTLTVYLRRGGKATPWDFDFRAVIPRVTENHQNKTNVWAVDDSTAADMLQTWQGVDHQAADELAHTLFIPDTEQLQKGVYYLGLQARVLPEEDPPDSNLTVRVATFTSGCRYWDTHTEMWRQNGCRVSPMSTVKTTKCLCSHLTSFGSDFVVPPNTIDFSTVFSKFASLSDNAPVFSTVLSIIGLYCIVVGLARRADRKDIVKWGVSPLVDNDIRHSYHYQLAVYTGMRKDAGTRSSIGFVLSSDKGDTGTRRLDDKGKKVFDRGSVNNFLLSVPRCLGNLQYLRVWHDNSGKGRNASWFLDKIIITDLQTEKRTYFFCGQWLAVEEGDGVVERLLPAAGEEDVLQFQNLFVSNSRKNMTDGHLWMSVRVVTVWRSPCHDLAPRRICLYVLPVQVLSRPTRSTFTRVQRASCCLLLLFTSMITSCMFYQAPLDPDAPGLHLGLFSITYQELSISIQSTLVVLPVNLLVVNIFRKLRAKDQVAPSKGNYGKNIKAVSSSSLTKRHTEKPREKSSNKEKENNKPVGSPHKMSTTLTKEQDPQPDCPSQKLPRKSQEKGDSGRAKNEDQSLPSLVDRNDQPPVQKSCKSSETEISTPRDVVQHVRTLHGGETKTLRRRRSRDTLAAPNNRQYCVSTSLTAPLEDSHTENDTNLDFEETSNVQSGSTRRVRAKPSKIEPTPRGLEKRRQALKRTSSLPRSNAILPYDHSEVPVAQSESTQSLDNANTTEDKQLKPLHVRLEESVARFEEAKRREERNKTSEKNKAKPETKKKKQTTKKKKKPFLLPHWFLWVAYVIVYGGAMMSGFFTILYSLEWGYNKSTQWLVTFLLSFFQDALVVQPVKVVVMAALVSLIVKKSDEEETEKEDDNNQLGEDEEAEAEVPDRNTQRGPHPQPPKQDRLRSAREVRIKELKMEDVVRTSVLHLAFLAVIVTVSLYNRGDHAYYLHRSVTNTFLENRQFKQIHTADSLWMWAEEVLLPNLYPDVTYSNTSFPLRHRKFVSDGTSFRVGRVRLRQLRVTPTDQCPIPVVMRATVPKCNVDYSWTNEDTRSMSQGWVPQTDLSNHRNNTNHAMTTPKTEDLAPWRYEDAIDLTSAAFYGELHLYRGGGYAVVLKNNAKRAKTQLSGLKKTAWLDKYTRAVFVEFSLYSPPSSLFMAVTIVLEFTTVGDVTRYPRIQSVRLYGVDPVITTCKALYCLFVLYFIGREGRRIRRKGRDYFRSFWNCVEIPFIVLEVAAVALYGVRTAFCNDVLGRLNERGGFVNFQSAAWWNDVYSYVLACLVFASIAKFLTLLRFNGRMAMLSYVIRRATNELVHFTVMFFVIFLAHCQVTYLLLGTTLAGFGTFQASLEMMFAILLGDVDLSWVLKASPLSCVFLLTFILTLVMVIVNMFLAILVDSIKHVKDDVRRLKRENELTDFMIHRLKTMFKLTDKTSHPSIKTTTPQPEHKPYIRTTHEVATSPLPSPRTIPGVENTTEEKGQVAETSQMDKPVENPTDPAGAFDVTDLPGRVEHLLHYVYGQYGGDITIDRPQSTAEASSPSESPDSEDVDEELKYLRNDETSPTASLDSFELQLQHGQTPLGHPRDQILTTSRGNTPPDRASVSPVTPREGPSPQSYGSKTPSPVGGAVLSTTPAKSDTKKSSKSDEKRFYHKVSTSLSVDVVVHIASKESSDAEDLTDPDPDRLNKHLDVDTLSSKPPISPRVPSIHKKQSADKKRSRSDRRQKMSRRSSVSPKRESQRDDKKSEYEDFGDASWGRAGARSATSSPVDEDCPSPPYPPPPRPFLPSREGSTTVQLASGWRRPRVQKLKFRHSMAGNMSEVDGSDKALGLPAFTPRHSPELTPRTDSPDPESPRKDKEGDSKRQNTPGEDEYLGDDNPSPAEETSTDMEGDDDMEGP